MNEKIKKLLLFMVVLTFVSFLYFMSNEVWDNYYILFLINGFCASSLIFLNMKTMDKESHKIYIFVLIYTVFWFIGDTLYVLNDNGLIPFEIVDIIIELFYIVGSGVLAILGLYVIMSNFKKIDKKQILMDLVAISVCIYFIFIEIFRVLVSNFVMFKDMIFTFTLFTDILVLIVTLLIISTFRSKKFNKSMILNIIAFIVFASLDFSYIYMETLKLEMNATLIDWLYALPTVLFAISSSIRCEKKEEIKLNDDIDIETPLNYGSSHVISIMFLTLVAIEMILYQSGEITYNQLFFIFGMIISYMIASLNYQNFMKSKMEIQYHIKITEKLESRVYERTQELETKNKQLLTIVNTDILTELGSRKYLIDILDLHEVSYLNRDVALFVIDIVQFKNINNVSGNRVGDMVLKEVAERLTKLFPNDKVFRTDSNEFVILLESKAANENMLEFLAKDITNSLSSTIYVDTYRISLNIAIGCAKYPGCELNDFGELLTNAEYAAKEVKKEYNIHKNYRLYDDDMELTIKRRTNIESLLQTINYDEEFVMHFQPQFSVDGSKLVGMESLIRWNSPILGFVSPGEFIPIAESTNIIIKIVQWTLIKSIDIIKYWNEKYDLNCKIAVNISPKYIENYDFLNEVKYFIDSKGVNPNWLDFEITEMTVMQVGDSVFKIFESLHAMGINISIDDFGTGYSSLSYIKNFKVNKLKIAKELIDNITTDKNEYMIVNAIIMMANGLNLNTIAEGAEYKEQKDILQELGCNQIQGYYYGRPVPAKEFEKLYLRNKKITAKKENIA